MRFCQSFYIIEPRCQSDKIDPLQHVADFEAAMRAAQQLSAVDKSRLALWGTSFGGGHVLVTAARRPSELAAVISQMPFLGAVPGDSAVDELAKRGAANVLLGAVGAVASLLRQALGMGPLYARLYGHVGDGAKMALNWWESFGGDERAWTHKHPAQRDNDWRNAVLVDSLVHMMPYKPAQHVASMASAAEAPKVLVVKAKHDLLCPNHRMDHVIALLRCEQHTEDTTHFGMYTGDTFESVIAVQRDFFLRHLKPVKTLKVLE